MKRRSAVLILLGVMTLAAATMLVAWLVLDLDVTHFAALALGVVFSIAVGVGLMALVFYSSRSGHDDMAHNPQPDERTPEDRRPAGH